MAAFKVNKIFKIIKRGVVLSGIIVDGEISSGDLLLLEADQDTLKLKIKSVEYVDYGQGYAEIGLILGAIEDEVNDLLRMTAGNIVAISQR